MTDCLQCRTGVCALHQRPRAITFGYVDGPHHDLEWYPAGTLARERLARVFDNLALVGALATAKLLRDEAARLRDRLLYHEWRA